MYKSENKCIVVLSTILFSFILFYKVDLGPLRYLSLTVTPTYLLVGYLINRFHEGREMVRFAVNSCLEESDFNVIDNIEKLRDYFSDTKDVVEYLSIVDSRLLTYIFDDKNRGMCFKSYIEGAVTCLEIFKHYNGYINYNIDIFSIPDREKIKTLLSVIYMVSRQMDDGSSTIYITVRQSQDQIEVYITNQFRSNNLEDGFTTKLMDIFSTGEYQLMSKY